MKKSSHKAAAAAVSPKESAEWKIGAALIVRDLEEALVQARLVGSANRNTPTRETLALARAHATAALGGIADLQGRVSRDA